MATMTPPGSSSREYQATYVGRPEFYSGLKYGAVVTVHEETFAAVEVSAEPGVAPYTVPARTRLAARAEGAWLAVKPSDLAS